MKLQEFLSFRKTCFVCNEPILFKVTDWSDFKNPIIMNAYHVIGEVLLKLVHSDLILFFNFKRNSYIIYPNVPRKVQLEIEGHCKKNHNHYMYSSQMLVLNPDAKRWVELDSIEAQEVISINNGNLFSVVNNYEPKQTTVVFTGGKEHVVLPLVNTAKTSYEELYDKLRIYLTFQ